MRYWSIAHTVGTCGLSNWDKELFWRQALAQMSLVLPTALSPTKTHLTSSWLVLSSSIIFLPFYSILLSPRSSKLQKGVEVFSQLRRNIWFQSMKKILRTARLERARKNKHRVRCGPICSHVFTLVTDGSNFQRVNYVLGSLEKTRFYLLWRNFSFHRIFGNFRREITFLCILHKRSLWSLTNSFM